MEWSGFIARKFTLQGDEASIFDEMKAEEYRYWQNLSPAERFAAGHQLSVESYKAYGYSADGSELTRSATRFEQAPR